MTTFMVRKCFLCIINVNKSNAALRKCGTLYSCRKPVRLQTCRLYHESGGNSDDEQKLGLNDDSKQIPLGVSTKFKIFRDEDSPIILDVEEERAKFQDELAARLEVVEDEFAGINLQRVSGGVRGVFNTEELVALLRRDRAEDIFVAELPPHFKYVDHIVVVTGKSQRHRLALAELVRKVFKRKRHPSDVIPKIEGKHSKDWIALDLGNIALHIMSKAARDLYDIEMLWSVGADHDDQCNKADDAVVSLLKHHAIYLGDLKPLESHG